MDKQKVVVLLLIVAIVLSAINLFVSASFNTDFTAPTGGQGAVDTDLGNSASIGVEILPSGGAE